MDIPLANLNNLPHRPGTYVYRDKNKAVLYVGKALDLRKRVRQYFTRDDAVGDKTLRLVAQIASIEITTTPTEFDALLLEAELIRTLIPKYNVIARDDKSPLYIVITFGETLPRVLQLRKTQLRQVSQGDPLQMASKRAIFGPFQSSRTVRDLLRTIRNIIPYCTQKQRNGKPCFYTHIGLCDPCPSIITNLKDKQRYRKNIHRIRDIFAGRAARVMSLLQKEMEELAKEEQFEAAERIKRQVLALIALQQKRINPMLYIQKDTDGLAELRAILLKHISTLGILSRIECIDISNISGKFATGSLVVLTDGVPDTNQYRRFRIHTNPPAGGPNDVAMVQEVLTRRLHHPEWPYPDLLVIDGGKPQVAAARGVTEKIPIIGLSKRFEEIIVCKEDGFTTLRLPLNNPAIHVVQRIRDEAHRFAKAYHVWLRRKLLAQ